AGIVHKLEMNQLRDIVGIGHGKTCPEAVRRIHKESLSGERNRHWNGGLPKHISSGIELRKHRGTKNRARVRYDRSVARRQRNISNRNKLSTFATRELNDDRVGALSQIFSHFIDPIRSEGRTVGFCKYDRRSAPARCRGVAQEDRGYVTWSDRDLRKIVGELLRRADATQCQHENDS